MSETQLETSGLKAQYATQVTADLERNASEQERLGAEVAALQERLDALRHDRELLLSIRQTLDAEEAQAAAESGADDGKGAAEVPSPRRAGDEAAGDTAPAAKPARKKSAGAKPRTRAKTGRTAGAKKAGTKAATSSGTRTGRKAGAAPAARTEAKPAAAEPAAAKSPATTPTVAKTTVAKAADTKTADTKPTAAQPAAAKNGRSAGGKSKKEAGTRNAARQPDAVAADRPTLVSLVHDHLRSQSEPRSAAEIATALDRAHPDRTVKATVVRTTVEGLVAKGLVERGKQGSSVFYVATHEKEARTPAPADG
ncbi:BlaI/MecI/CopY family transcriptional regulator [Streptomyces sp. NPDC008313]|uniref:BlaI/MecI/CopY family transcriptional regulator n=1 Tax=Streptomyces sp. NPDC008313 TaxID=3364826 RepID=UPI0036E8416B